jgi:multidrug efflux system outer membrane protein
MKKKYLCLFFALFLSGCLVGPNYHPPATLLPDHFTEDDPQATIEIDDNVFCEWWGEWNDPVLNELMAITTQKSFDYRIALEMMWQARADYLIASANLAPQINVDTFATRARNSKSITGFASLLGQTFQNFFLVGFDAVWQIDVFGGLERARRAARFTAESAAENTKAVQITVLSEVAMNYVAIRTLQTRVAIAQEIAESDRENLALVQDRFQAGLSSDIDVEVARRLYDTDVAILKSLETTLKQGMYSLGSIVGLLPEEIADRLTPFGSIPQSSGKIPVDLPSELLRRRPDIRSVERSLAAATEQIGVAVADLFPQFSLTSSNLFGSRFQSSNYGYASNHVSNLFKNASKTWSLGLATFWPIIDFGRRLEAVGLQTSVQRQALVTYEKTVVQAIGEVESSLIAYKNEEVSYLWLENEVQSALKSYGLYEDLYQSGLASYEQVLSSRKTLLNARNSFAQSAQALSTNLIALYKALGGEWECCSLQ